MRLQSVEPQTYHHFDNKTSTFPFFKHTVSKCCSNGLIIIFTATSLESLKACTLFFIRMLGHFNTFHMFPAVQTYPPLSTVCTACLARSSAAWPRSNFRGESNTLLPESLPLPEKGANIEAGEYRVFLVTVPVLLKGGSRDWIIAYHYLARFESKLHQN